MREAEAIPAAELIKDELFAEVPPKFLLWQEGLVTRTKVKDGDVLCKQGDPGNTAFTPLAFDYYPWSHSLVMDVAWGCAMGLVYLARNRDRRGAFLIGGLVVSHWVLDFASHPPDMALAPGLTARFGLGLWNSIPATLAIEGAFWVFAIIIYLRLARSQSWAFRLVFWIPALFLTLAWYGNIAGPPPTNPSIIGYTSLTFFSLTVGWAYWCNRRFKTCG